MFTMWDMGVTTGHLGGTGYIWGTALEQRFGGNGFNNTDILRNL